MDKVINQQKMEVHNGDDDRILIIQGMKNNAVIKLVGGKKSVI